MLDACAFIRNQTNTFSKLFLLIEYANANFPSIQSFHANWTFLIGYWNAFNAHRNIPFKEDNQFYDSCDFTRNCIYCIFRFLERSFDQREEASVWVQSKVMDYLRLASLKLLLLFSVLAWAVNSSHEKQNIPECPNSCICGTTSTLRSVLSGPDTQENAAINCTGMNKNYTRFKKG